MVFYASTGQLKTGYFGVLTQGFPQLVRVNWDVLKLEAKDGWPEDAPVHCRVRMINEFPMIPDREKLEAILARESLQATATRTLAKITPQRLQNSEGSDCCSLGS